MRLDRIDPWFAAEMAALARGEDPQQGLERSFKSVDTRAAGVRGRDALLLPGWERRAAHEVRRAATSRRW